MDAKSELTSYTQSWPPQIMVEVNYRGTCSLCCTGSEFQTVYKIQELQRENKEGLPGDRILISK